MRPLILLATAAAGLILAASAQAAPIGPVAQISVTFGKDVDVQKKVIGKPEKARLERELRRTVERQIGGLMPGGGRLELVIEDAKPNRPTWTEMAAKPGLSYIDSYSIGGASVSGVYVAPSGERTPVEYHWYGYDIRESQFVSDWYDADMTFDRFARKLTRG